MTTEVKNLYGELFKLLQSRTLPRQTALKLYELLKENEFKNEQVMSLLAHRTHPEIDYIIEEYDEKPEADKENYWYGWFSGSKYMNYKQVKTPSLEEALKSEFKPNSKLRESFMGTKMSYRLPMNQIFSNKRVVIIREILEANEDKFVIPQNELEYIQLVEKLRRILQAGDIVSYKEQKRNHKRPKKLNRNSRDKKNSYIALYKEKKFSERHEIPKNIRNNKKYTEALNILGILEGRLKNIFYPLLKATCASLDKSGLATLCIKEDDLKADLNTSIWIVQQISELSVRKEFTIEKQQQGGLNVHMQWMFDNILMKSETTRWDLVAYIHPIKSVLEKCKKEHLQTIQEHWMMYLPLLAQFLQKQWTIGVNKCVDRNMMVPMRQRHVQTPEMPILEPDEVYIAEEGHIVNTKTGETKNIVLKSPTVEEVVDSTGWNLISGSWNNAIRQARGIWNALEMPHQSLFKCLKLTAGDQMKWAEVAGKGTDADTEVFKTLVKKDIYPWSALNGMSNKVIYDAVVNACNENKVNPEKWLRAPKGWNIDTKFHNDMICGVSVIATKETADVLKECGIFGSSCAPLSDKN
ncbi:MAG: hypothetical protein Edafosvirus1_151 [Edafosvirus sp.]|uniref:Uncharacterized protein n=1 Tax=Edafosvirus sp. TaxID=2487765 RepID=A0A3G4ZSE3_9VIRU|nr:MAG: hypothetical protein Edafosvirus1_151 [Edafosvirus sp.]